MNCDEVELKLDQLLDGELSEDGDDTVFQHLAQCPACRRYMTTIAQIRSVARGDFAAIPTDLDERVLGGSPRGNGLGRQLWRRMVHVPLPLAAAAVICLIALTAFALLRDRGPEPEQAVTGNLVDVGRVEYLYLLPAVEVVGSDEVTTVNGSTER